MALWGGDERCCVLVYLCVVVGALMVGPSLQAAAPAPAVDCTTVVFGLSDCLTYVMGNVSKPASACCSELAPVISGTPQCLCTLFNTTLTASFGIVINTTLALQLPAACNLTAPPVSQCAALGFPVPGPVSSAPTVSTPVSSKAPTVSVTPSSSPAVSVTPSAASTPSVVPSSAPTPSVTPSSAPTPSVPPVSSPTSSPKGSVSPTVSGTAPTTGVAPAPSSASRFAYSGAICASLLLVASLRMV